MIEIIKAGLKALGYNALSGDDGCMCIIGDDFMTCRECEPVLVYEGYCTPSCYHEEIGSPVAQGDIHFQHAKPIFPLVDPFVSFNHAGVEYAKEGE